MSYLIWRFFAADTVSMSWIYLLAYAGIYRIFKAKFYDNEGLIGNRIFRILSFILSLTIVTGIHFDNGYSFANMTIGIFVNFIICIIGLMPVCQCVFNAVFHIMYNFPEHERSILTRKKAIFYGGAMAAILACWFFVWLAYYPGLLNYDAYWQVTEFTEGIFSKHHPLVHTLLLGICYSMGENETNCNNGVIIYDCIQMLIMAAIFAYAYVYVSGHMTSKIFRGVMLAFYALFPVNSVMAISSTKDVIFSGLILLCVVLALKIWESDSKGKRNFLTVMFVAACVLMLLFRNNAIYAFYLLVVFAVLRLICSVIKKKKRETGSIGVIILCFCCILLFHVADFALTNILDAKAVNPAEMLSVPSQQFGRVYDMLKKSGTDEETMEKISLYYDAEKMTYKTYLADTMKGNMINPRNNAGYSFVGYAKNYIIDYMRLICRYPLESIDAFVYLTEGSWYVNDTSYSDIYGHEMKDRQGALQTKNKPEFNIVHESKMPRLELFMEKMFSGNDYQKLPILALLFSPALYIWILVICTVVFVTQRDWKFLLPAVFLWTLYLTNLLGPCVLIRYYYPYFVFSPLLLCMARMSICGSRYGISEE